MRKLTASDGMVLTNGKTCGKEIYLGINDTPENWWEITEEASVEMATEEDYLNALMNMGVKL